jgi:hypothetical protein
VLPARHRNMRARPPRLLRSLHRRSPTHAVAWPMVTCNIRSSHLRFRRSQR